MNILYMKGVPEEVREATTRFLGHLPNDRLGTVKVSVSDEGTVTFVWQRTANWVLSLDIDQLGMITYSGVFQSSRGSITVHGGEPVQDRFSLALDFIFTLLSTPPADVRAAMKEIDGYDDADTDYKC